MTFNISNHQPQNYPPQGNTPLPSNKRKREIKPAHLAPSLTKVDRLDETIREHAFTRIQIFFVTSMAFYQRALRTSGAITQVSVNIRGAVMQVGQGNKENHAAHANAGAYVVDNLKENILKQIDENGLSPKKRKILKEKGVSEENLKQIDKHHKNKQLVAKIVNHVWVHESLLRFTEIELLSNLTNQLPALLNLGCDLPLEKKIRPEMEKLYASCMKGEIKPEKATDALILIIQNHFKSKIEELKQSINSCKNPEKLKKLQENLRYHQLELEGSQTVDYDLLKKGFTIKNSNEIDQEATLIFLKPLK